jgi:hypothetical protein
MTPDEVRILTWLRELDARFTRLEKKVVSTTPSTTTTVQETIDAYRQTLKASPTDATLHDAFTDAPHVRQSDKDLWNGTTQEVITARTRITAEEHYSSLSRRLEAMEQAILAVSGSIDVSDSTGNAVSGVTSLEFIGGLVSGITPDGVVSITGGPSSHTHVWNETPVGTVDGSNTAYTLNSAPLTSNSVVAFLNGVVQKYGLDYNVTGTNLTLMDPPHVGDVLWVTYII